LFEDSKIYDSDWSIFTNNPRPKGVLNNYPNISSFNVVPNPNQTNY